MALNLVGTWTLKLPVPGNGRICVEWGGVANSPLLGSEQWSAAEFLYHFTHLSDSP